MNFFCEDCRYPARSYEEWTIHLVSREHQGISAPKIKQWVSDKNPSCIIMISIFTTKDPTEVAKRFSKFGFLWNFYVHPDHKFFIMQYDNKQTAAFTLKKANEDLIWKIQIRPLTDLSTEDWVALFPPTPVTQVAEPSPPPTKIPRVDANIASTVSTTSFQPSAGTSRQKALFQNPNNYQPQRTAGEQYLSSVRGMTQDTQLVNSNNNHQRHQTPSVIHGALLGNSDRLDTDISRSKRVEQPKCKTEVLPNPVHNSASNHKRNGMDGSGAVDDPLTLDQVPSNSFTIPIVQMPEGEPSEENKPGKMKNLKKKVPMEFLMKFTKGSSLDEQLDQFFKATALSLKELDKLNQNVVKKLGESLKHLYPASNLYLVDSFQGGMANSNLIIEICVDGLDCEYDDASRKSEGKRCQKLMSDLARKLQNEMDLLGPNKFCYSISLNLKDTASKVQFTNPISARHKFAITPCTTISQYTRRKHLKLINFFVSLHPSVRSLICLVYYWANEHQFMQFGFQQIRDYVLSLMVIVFLGRKKVVPTLERIQSFCRGTVSFSPSNSLENVLDNEDNVKKATEIIQKYFKPKEIFILDLAKGFFETYGDTKLQSDVICPWTAEFLPRTLFAKHPSTFPPSLLEYKKYLELNPESSLDLTTPLCVQSVFELGFNIGRSSTSKCFRKIQTGFRQTAVLLENLLNPDQNEGNLMSMFAPIQKEIQTVSPPKPSTSADGQQTELSAALTTLERRICQETLGRVQTRMQVMNILFPLCGNERVKFSYFEMEDRFVKQFRKYVQNFQRYRVDQQTMFSHVCGLFSTFSIEFIRNVWDKCWFMEAKEEPIFEQHQARCANNSDFTSFGQEFPLPYASFYSLFNINGYLPLRAGFRWECRTNGEQFTPLATNTSSTNPNPFDEEWAVTEISLKKAESKRRRGKAIWKFECTVVYEDAFSDHQVPRICFIISGNDPERGILDYVTSGLRRMFYAYQFHRMECWFAAASTSRAFSAPSIPRYYH